jgi:hypothetical protein
MYYAAPARNQTRMQNGRTDLPFPPSGDLHYPSQSSRHNGSKWG